MICLPAFFLVGNLFYRVLLRRVSGTDIRLPSAADHQAQLVITLGISMILQNSALMFFGTRPRSVTTELSSEAWIIDISSMMLFINKAQFIIAAIAFSVVALLVLLMNVTSVGRRMRAVASNAMAATYMGIDFQKQYATAFGLSLALTAMLGSLMITYLSFHPYTGFDFIIIMYAGVVLGGMGTLSGAFLGGVMIGIIQQVSTLFLPVQLQNMVVFTAFLLVIILRPQGLFGRDVSRV